MAGYPTRLAPSGAVADGTTALWHDRKRYLWLIGLIVPSLAFLAFGGYLLTGLGIWLWLGPIVVLGVVPLIDLVAGFDHSNPPDDVIEALENDRYYRWIVYTYLPIQYLGFAVGMGICAGWDVFGLISEPLSTLDKIGAAISIGCVGGIGINTAHELGHKKESHERWLSKIALAQSFYGHFYIEHNRGHHVRVATPEDPASARLGETVYEFWPRTVVGSLRSAWGLEKRRLARRQRHPWQLDNDVLNAWLMSLLLFGVVIAVFGWGVTPYLIIQALVGITLLEIVNYLEHYGMLRQKVGVGERERYERVLPSHSWNSNNIATNVLLYHLQRHSDHHANPTRRYQALRDYKESPVLPTGYAGMIVAALIPPLFRRLMDHRVLDHFDGDVTLANLHQRTSKRYLKKYAAAPVVPVARREVTQEQLAEMDGWLAAKCPGCEYVYEVAAGDEHQGFAAGTAWAEIPDDWCCPDCGVREKVDFVAVE